MRRAQSDAADYLDWLKTRFPNVASKPLGTRHNRLWQWFSDLKWGSPARTRVEVWPRGGAKSSTAELGVAYLAERLSRRFVLYVSETQDQANKHVQAIGGYLEKLGIKRLIGTYGHSKGWRCDVLRTATGFNVVALGLDAASRGVKLDEFRPDLILLDDIDSQDDTAKKVEKKIDTITTAILPTGSIDCAVLFIQNLIHEDGIVSRLVDGRADFLMDREVPPIEPAIVGLKYEIQPQSDGSNRYVITEGVPTWEGQDLETCADQLNKWGERAFLREAQHQVRGASGWYFDADAFEIIDEIPAGIRFVKLVRAWDMAATQGGGDWTVGALMGITANGVVYVLDVIRHQLSPEGVQALIKRTAERDRKGELWEADTYRFGRLEKLGKQIGSFLPFVRVGASDAVTIHLAQDPAQAGKFQASLYRTLLKGFALVIKSVSGKKAVRARTWAAKSNARNARLLKGAWNGEFITEHRRFTEDESHEFDDQVDAGSDGCNFLVGAGNKKSASSHQG